MQMSFEQARTKMVDNQIRPCDVTDYGLISAFQSVPREEFVAEEHRELAYLDRDYALGEGGRSMLSPAMLAKLIQLTEVNEEDVVLLIGAGTGYTPALFSSLASSVVALEEDEALANQADENLNRLGYANVAVLNAPFAEGFAREAPYDVIFSEASVEFVPEEWLEQLGEGGRFVCVMGTGSAARAVVHTKQAGIIGVVAAFNCSAPLLPGFQKKAEFAL